MLAPGNDVFHLIFQALKFSLLTDDVSFLHKIFCSFVCLFYLMSLFVFVLFVLLQTLVFIFNFRNLWFVLDVWDKVQH